MSDLERAVKALQEKQGPYNTLWAYYDGNQPLRYSTERLREIFRSIEARFTQNWCEVVVDVFEERINIEQFQVTGNEAAAKSLNDWWYTSGLHLDADDVHLCALVTGEAFVIVWPEEDGALDGHYNDSRLVHLFYDPANPRRKLYGAKWYEDAEAKRTYLTLYYPDRLEYYATDRLIKELHGVGGFRPLPLDPADEASYIAENPLGIIPIFHYRREMRAIKSELAPSILDTQDAINKLLSDMMVAAEFGAFRQRYVISQADVGSLKNAPNEIWDLPAGDGLGQGTQVGEFGQTDLSTYMDQLQELASSIGKMKRLPAHYFHLGARADPSGETLIGLESPLIKRVRKYMKRFEASWVEVASLALAWQGIELPGNAPYVVYDDPRINQPKTLAETRKINVEAGIPLHTQLRIEGWTPRELAEMEADKRMEQQAAQQGMAAALLAAQREFDQS